MMEIGVLVSFCLGWNARGVRRPMRLRYSGSFGGGRRRRPPRARAGGAGWQRVGRGWLREYYLTWCVCCFIMCRLAYTDNCGLGQQLLLVTTSALRQLLLFLPTEAGLPRYFQPAKASSPGDLRDIQYNKCRPRCF